MKCSSHHYIVTSDSIIVVTWTASPRSMVKHLTVTKGGATVMGLVLPASICIKSNHEMVDSSEDDAHDLKKGDNSATFEYSSGFMLKRSRETPRQPDGKTVCDRIKSRPRKVGPNLPKEFNFVRCEPKFRRASHSCTLLAWLLWRPQ